ncbi:MAG: guanylate kinase [Anaerolineae bacterium]|jgi:guanylate kinase|nr:guanylate kinase [Anaerolineae bacterium]MDH7475690.1 guanylate kinase [Anaerolineae bacterium]
MACDPFHRETYPLLVVISGPSGVGKDAVRKRMQERGCPFHFVVTATDRPQRPGEVHGKDYYFVSTAEFDRMLADDELLEHAMVYGQHKGVPKAHVRQALASGQDVLMRVDVQGAATIRRLVPEAVLIFLMPSSEEELIHRLRRRRTESPEALQMRVALAREELKWLPEFDYVVVNRESRLDDTVDQIMAIITAEKCRVQPRKIVL